MNFIDWKHHAYLIEGNREDKEKIIELLSAVNFNTRGNPDFYIIEEDVLKIEHAHKIKSFQSRKSIGYKSAKPGYYGPGKKVIFLIFDFITWEAQNALLKTLEEPSSGTHFVILAPSEKIFLPTVRSRVERLEIPSLGRPTSKWDNIDKFIESPIKVRMEIVGKLIKEIKDEEGEVGRRNARNFINSLIIEFRNKRNKLGAEEARYLKNLIKYCDYLNDRAPSIRQILEYSAVNLPK